MKNLLWISFVLIFFAGCAKNEEQAEVKLISSAKKTLNNVNPDQAALIAGDDWVWTANQASGKIEIYDPNVSDWNNASALKFEFEPEASKGYTPYALQNWDVPNDFKVRNIAAWGGNHLVTCASKGLVTIASYPGKIKKWAYAIGTTVHPHSVELLPNGNVAVACTDQHLVKVFMSSSSTVDNIVFASFPLNGAHSVLWDPTTSTIRAIGNDYVVSLVVGGTMANPTLTEVPNTRGDLVASGASLWGHDLSVDLNDTNILWASTNSGVYSFNKTTRNFTGAPGGNTGVNKTFVKGISRQNSGVFVITRADSQKNPQPSDPVTTPDWCTRYVDFYAANGSFLYYRTKSGAKFYKGKIFRTPY